MKVEMHPSVKKVAEFMTGEMPADELVVVAQALALLAPAIWGHYPRQEIIPLTLSGTID